MPSHPHKHPMTWNEVEYPSIRAASEALGVAYTTVQYWANHGIQSSADLSSKSRPCSWNDIDYPSVACAAQQLGISAPALLYRLKNGHTCDADLRHTSSKKQEG